MLESKRPVRNERAILYQVSVLELNQFTVAHFSSNLVDSKKMVCRAIPSGETCNAISLCLPEWRQGDNWAVVGARGLGPRSWTLEGEGVGFA